jgi:plastocyanin domain-containing protein
MKKIILIFTGMAFLITLLIFIATRQSSNSSQTQTDNVTTAEDGKQIITITAKGGYFPRTTNAKANTETTLLIETRSTFDCSSSLVIPSLNYKKLLPRSGGTAIDLPPQKPGTSIRGLCSMGMFNFTLNFN